jgi:hypothetical protein
MHETWLKTNRRILLLGMILPAVLCAVGLFVLWMQPLESAGWLQGIGWISIIAGILLFVILAAQVRLPRLAYAEGLLLLHLRAGPALRLPVQFVECFFLGTGSGQVPGKRGEDLPVRNLVVRLAEKAVEYHRRDVKPALGRWEDGYITIYGAWCEPLDVALVNGLNARLAEVKRAEEKGRKEAGERR